MGEDKTIRVGDNLQEDVHVVKNGGESGFLAIVLCDLVEGKRVEGQSEPGWASAILEQWTPALGLPLQSTILNGKGRLLWVLDTHWARAPSPPPHAYLLCKPDPTGLGDPLPGMNACVNPDGRTVISPSAKLDEKNRETVSSLKGNIPQARGRLLSGYLRWRLCLWSHHSGGVTSSLSEVINKLIYLSGLPQPQNAFHNVTLDWKHLGHLNI